MMVRFIVQLALAVRATSRLNLVAPRWF
jgi:hypothetical protein